MTIKAKGQIVGGSVYRNFSIASHANKMFKFATITLLGLALYSASARPQADSTTPVSVVSLVQSVDENGFNYAFELSNGIKEEATGTSKTLKVPKIDPQTNQSTGDEDSQVIVQQGKYSYTAPDGQLIQVSYIADENVSIYHWKSWVAFDTNINRYLKFSCF